MSQKPPSIRRVSHHRVYGVRGQPSHLLDGVTEKQAGLHGKRSITFRALSLDLPTQPGHSRLSIAPLARFTTTSVTPA